MKKIMINKSEVKVTIHIPDDISETVRQQKISRLYDILKPKIIMERKEKVA